MSQLSNSFKENFYNLHILPQFGIKPDGIKWGGHFSIQLEASAHFFFWDKNDYVLVFEDYPLIFESEVRDLLRRDQDIMRVALSDGRYLYHYAPDGGTKRVEDIAGTFSLYKIV